jgi:hypothetical protein
MSMLPTRTLAHWYEATDTRAQAEVPACNERWHGTGRRGENCTLTSEESVKEYYTCSGQHICRCMNIDATVPCTGTGAGLP